MSRQQRTAKQQRAPTPVVQVQPLPDDEPTFLSKQQVLERIPIDRAHSLALGAHRKISEAEVHRQSDGLA